MSWPSRASGLDLHPIWIVTLTTPEEIEALGVGFVRLELVPRGVGRLLVRVPQLFYSIEAGESRRGHPGAGQRRHPPAGQRRR